MMCINKMWFSISSFEICISATVFYSTFFSSKCQAHDIPGFIWKENDDSIRIYRTEVPWTPIDLNKEKNFAVVAWIAVLSVVVSATAIVCLCCLCWKLYPKYSSRRHPSNAALVPPHRDSTNVVTFHADRGADLEIRNSTASTGNVYRSGVINFAFTTSLHDPVTYPPREDGLPAYSAVVSQISDKSKPPNATVYPPVTDIKTVETPPPAYSSVAPFQ